MPDGSVLTACRVFVTTNRLLAYQMVDGAISRTVDMQIVPESVPADRGSLFGSLECAGPDGTAWVNRGRGCGCGSPLKALGPPIAWTRREAG